MSGVFDPYHKWLGIPPNEQPTNHYRLLGLALFESDPDVIANAADARMAHVRTFQTGPHSDLSQKILNEIAAAKICLLNPQKKAQYDAQLRAQLAAQGSGPPLPPPPRSAAMSERPAGGGADVALGGPPFPAAGGPPPVAPGQPELPAPEPILPVALERPASLAARMLASRRKSWEIPILAAMGGLGVVLLVALLIRMLQPKASAPGPVALEKPPIASPIPSNEKRESSPLDQPKSPSSAPPKGKPAEQSAPASPALPEANPSKPPTPGGPS